MNSAVKLLLAFIAAIGYAIIRAFIIGTIIWILWKYTISNVFPKAVELGYIANSITWAQAYCLSLLVSMLMPSSSSSKE